MNVIFTAIFIASMVAIAIFCPDKLLPTLLGGAENAVKMSLTLFCIYAVWTGLSKLAEKSGLSKGIAKGLKPVSRKIFKAIGELEKEKNSFAQKLLFVINATSIQILPTTVITLRASAGSAAPADIFLPSLICTAISTAVAVILYLAGNKLWR